MKAPLLFYVQHLLGVGHVKRAAAIARAIGELFDVHVVLGGEAVALADFGSATIHRLPAARAQDVTFKVLVDAEGKPIDEAWQRARRDMLLALEQRLAPRVLLIEHFPFGRGKFGFELLPMFAQARMRADTAILCSVRDVLVEKGSPGKSRKTVALLREWFDGVIVHGDPAVVPFEATFPSATAISDLVAYSGYVCDRDVTAAIASQSRTGGEVVVSIGGGAVGEELLRAAIAAARGGALPGRTWRLLAGSGLPQDKFAALAASAAGDSRIVVERARPDFPRLLERAGLSISQAGYNTIMDILATRCPALVVPFAAEGESEQAFRADLLAERGLLSVLAEDRLTPATLAAAAEAAAATPMRSHTIDLAGTAGTAAILKRWAGADRC